VYDLPPFPPPAVSTPKLDGSPDPPSAELDDDAVPPRPTVTETAPDTDTLAE